MGCVVRALPDHCPDDRGTRERIGRKGIGREARCGREPANGGKVWRSGDTYIAGFRERPRGRPYRRGPVSGSHSFRTAETYLETDRDENRDEKGKSVPIRMTISTLV